MISIGLSKEGILDYESFDEKPVHIIFAVAAGENQQKEYLRIMAKIVLILKSKIKREKLLSATTINEIYEIFKEV